MSNTDGTCKYVLDPDDPETWGGENEECEVDEKILGADGKWRCPHDMMEDSQFCIFHAPVDKKSDSETLERFLQVIERDEDDRYQYPNEPQFINAKFGQFNISEKIIPEVADGWIDLSYSNFTGKFISNNATINSKIILTGSMFEQTADFELADFQEEVSFNLTEFHRDIKFDYATFKKSAVFIDAEFYSDVGFEGTEFESESSFTLSKFHSSVNFINGKFEDISNFTGTTFNGSCIFSERLFKKDSDFRFAEFNSKANFSDAFFIAEADFEKSSFSSETSFAGAELEQSNFYKSNLTDADLSGAKMQNSILERALLNRCDMFGANLEGAKFYGGVFGDAQINEETKFGDRCVYDPKFDDNLGSNLNDEDTGTLTKAAGQYRIMEKLARENAFPNMVGHNFIRRQDIHREQHRQEGRWGRWLRATASKYVLEYGENPWRLIATGLLIVVGFGLLYPLVGGLQPTGGSTITASRVIENPLLLAQSIYYSTLTFTTLGMGDFLPVGLGRVLTTIETSLGAIIIALLVFVFGRRAAR